MLFGKYDVTRRVITKTNLSFAFPAKMPIVPGHILVCPSRQVENIDQLSTEELSDLFSLVKEIKKALQQEFGAIGFNCAFNEHEEAGQSVPHLHVHVVPRKPEDKGIVDYEPRQFLYRPGLRATSPQEELEDVAKVLSAHFTK